MNKPDLLIPGETSDDSPDALPEEFQQLGSLAEASPTQQAMFFALQSQAHIYGGTVDPVVVAARRGRNRAARAARRRDFAAIRRQARANRNHQRRFARGQAPDPLGLRSAEAPDE